MVAGNLGAGAAVELYRQMGRLRRFEERVVELLDADEIAAHAHEYVGQEAVAVGVSAALRTDDVVTSTHRGHGHVLAKGADPAAMFAELMGRESGCNRGRGGSMHIADLSLGIYGANGIVGAGAPIACGAARIFRDSGSDRVAVPFFGDGAMNQGVLLESLNVAAIWKLPLVFVCENNLYAITSPIREMATGELRDRAAAFGLAAEVVDGMDVLAVRDAATRLIEAARRGAGAGFLECRTYRFSGHFTAERGRDFGYRTAAEIEEWRTRDPLDVLARRLDAESGWAAGDRSAIDAEVAAEIEAAIETARAAPRPDPASALDHMYARTYPGFPAGPTG